MILQSSSWQYNEGCRRKQRYRGRCPINLVCLYNSVSGKTIFSFWNILMVNVSIVY